MNVIKIQFKLPAGQASMGPPIGPVLGQYGIDTFLFCKQFNDLSSFITKGCLVLVDLIISEDRAFSFSIKKPSISFLLSFLVPLDGKIKREVLLRHLFKISILKGSKYSNKFIFCKMAFGTFCSFGFHVE